MVTRDNSDVSATFRKFGNRLINIFTEWVRESKGCNHRQFVFNVSAVVLTLKVVELDHHLLEFIQVEVSVGNRDSFKTSEQLLSILVGFLGFVSSHDNFLLNNVCKVVLTIV